MKKILKIFNTLLNLYNYNFLFNPSYYKEFINYNLYNGIKNSKKIDSIKIPGQNSLFYNKSIK